MTTDPQTDDLDRLADTDLDEIAARAGHLFEYVTMPSEADQLAGVDVPALIGEVRRLRALPAAALPSIHANDVEGFCPACGHGVLMLGEGGHVVCTLMDCPRPEAADELLRNAAAPVAAPPTGQTATLTEAERAMLTYALDQAQERIWSEDGFTDEDQAAVTSLRRLAAETPGPETQGGKSPVCEGFRWIGQSFATCDRCGQPAWDHAGEEVAVAGAGPFDSRRTVRPWKPGEADAIRAKWGTPTPPAVVAEPDKENDRG